MDADKSVHAEDQAIRKLPKNESNRIKKLDLLVIRVNKSGGLGNSKPCIHCLWLLSDLLPKRGYNVSRVYYSDEHGRLVMTKLKNLLEDEKPHVSKYYKDRSYSPRKK